MGLSSSPSPRPAQAIVRVLHNGAGWVLFLSITTLAGQVIGLLPLLSGSPVPAASGPDGILISLITVAFSAPSIAAAGMLLRYGLSARRLGHRPTTGEVEETLEQLATFWQWAAVALLTSLGFVALAAIAAAVRFAMTV
ncbi:MAG: hypothetical protein JW751_01345 [Polyangiaceae bacterium]|nr:hypothetical protein [Polyangiaceae bacterium]